MHSSLRITISPGSKTWDTSKKVITSVLEGRALREGDVGAFIVGVFACQPLTADGSRYDGSAPGQWSHCLYKAQWTAALRGSDQFTDEQRSLILAGYDLVKRYGHGWGTKATAQRHVKAILQSWVADQQADSGAHEETEPATVHAIPAVPSRDASEPLPEPEMPDVPVTFDTQASESTIGNQKSVSSQTLFEAGREWLIDCTAHGLTGFTRGQAEVIVDLHLGPRNYVLDRIFDFTDIRTAIKNGQTSEDVSHLLTFEDITTILGIFRVHCRNLVNRQGVSDINQGGMNPTKSPRILAFLDSLDDRNWHSFGDCGLLADHYLQVARLNKGGVFSEADIQSFTKARELGDRILSLSYESAVPSGIMQGWVKAIKGISGGVRYLRRYEMDVGRFIDHVSSMCKSYEGTMGLLSDYRTIPEVGPALAANFFADLGFKEFCKPDTHVRDVIEGLHGAKFNEQEVFDRMLRLAKESGVPPRQLDKVFYLAGSGNFYLINRSLPTGRSDRMRRKQSLTGSLRTNYRTQG